MKCVFDKKNGSEYVRTVCGFSRLMIASMAGIAILISFLPRAAHSFDGLYGRINERTASPDELAMQPADRSSPSSSLSGNPHSILQDSLSNGNADACLPLLSRMRHAAPREPVDRSQRSAGKAAALGLIFGVRFALTPPVNGQNDTQATASLELRQPAEEIAGQTRDHNRSALTVAAFRQCQKQQALKALNGFRWSR